MPKLFFVEFTEEFVFLHHGLILPLKPILARHHRKKELGKAVNRQLMRQIRVSCFHDTLSLISSR